MLKEYLLIGDLKEVVGREDQGLEVSKLYVQKEFYESLQFGYWRFFVRPYTKSDNPELPEQAKPEGSSFCLE